MKVYIAEKPKVAAKIAQALGELEGEKPKRVGGKYYAYYRVGGDAVAPAVGHIFQLYSGEKGYPVLNPKWVEAYKVSKELSYTKPYVEGFRKLLREASEAVVATDYDIEGSLIGYNVVRFLAPRLPVARAKFSALTVADLKKALSQPLEFDYSNAYAGEARHIVDWLYGINMSRALMEALRKAGLSKVLSIGRVQGPTLAIVVRREREREAFTPQEYAVITFTAGLPYKATISPYEKGREVYKKMGPVGTVRKVEVKQERLGPFPAFNLSDLQQEAYRLYRISPAQTLTVAQSLYERGLISYPRTESQQLPPTIGYRAIMERLAKQDSYRGLVESLPERLRPKQGKKRDPAHPAIYPTGQRPAKLSKREWQIYDLIVRRFLGAFMEPAQMEKAEVVVENVIPLEWKGQRVVKEGFLRAYPFARPKEEWGDLPREGQEVRGKKGIKKEKTKPPARYSTASLVRELEKRRLGTKATRAVVVETLFKRGYIENERSIRPTPLGVAVEETFQVYLPSILDEEMTRSLELDLEGIQEGRKSVEEVVEKAKAHVVEIAEEFKGKEEAIGKALLKGIREGEERKRVGVCPQCGSPLVEKRGRYGAFIGCSNYPNCSFTLPLPRNAIIVGVCENGMPRVKVKAKRGGWFEKCLEVRE